MFYKKLIQTSGKLEIFSLKINSIIVILLTNILGGKYE